MATYLTTYSAGVSKMKMDAGNSDPADANAPPWDGTDDGHPSAADKPIEERVPWTIPTPPVDPALEIPPEVEGEQLPPGETVPPPLYPEQQPQPVTAAEGAPA